MQEDLTGSMLAGRMKTEEGRRKSRSLRVSYEQLCRSKDRDFQPKVPKVFFYYFHDHFAISHVLVPGSWISIDLPALNQPPTAHTTRSPRLCSIYSQVTFALTGSASASALNDTEIENNFIL